MACQKVLIGHAQAVLQAHPGLPAQRLQPAAVHQLARRAVWLAAVKVNLALVAHHLADGTRQLGNGDVAAVADVDVALHRAGVLVVDRFGQVHDMHAGRRHVVNKQEFTAWRSRAPDGDLGCVAGLGFVKSADQRGNDVAVFRVVVVTRAVQVGGHDAAVVDAVAGTVLAVVALAQLDTGNLGNRIGLVGGLQQSGEQCVFGHRLRGLARVDAAGTEEQQLLHAVLERRINHVGLHHQILVDEVGRVGVVGMNATDLGGGQIDLSGLLRSKKRAYSRLVGQVELFMGAGDDAFGHLAGGQQLANNGRAHHAAMAGDVDARR